MALEKEIVNQKAKNRMLKKEKQSQKVYNLIKTEENKSDKEPVGNPVGVCKRCGKKFDQDFVPDRNAYTDWKTCADCRQILAGEKAKKIGFDEKAVQVGTLPFEPFPWQIEAAEAFEKHRFQVLSCGNRSGKDRYSIMTGIKYFVECLNENRQKYNPEMVPAVLWWQLAPTEKMAKQNWRELKQYFPKEWVVACSDSSYTMQTIGGGIIEVRSGYDPDSLVGVGLDLVTITEAARFKDLNIAWANLEARLNSPGRGRKKDRLNKNYGQGKAIINSSPLGKNDFYHLWCRGQKNHEDYSSVWWSAQYPWTCNPYNEELAREVVHTRYGKMTYEETLKRQLGTRLFQSNYLADFVAEDGSVFKNFEEKCVINLFTEVDLNGKSQKDYIKEWQKPDPTYEYIGGYDPATGSSGDTPAFVIRCVNTNRIVRVFDLYGRNYSQQYEFIANMCKMYNYAPIHWLRTGHTAIEGEFEKRGITEVPIDEQGSNKAKLVQTLELAVENGDVQVLMDGSSEVQTLIYQMNDYVERGGKYMNDQQPHDDYCSALYAAYSTYTVNEIPIGYCGLMGRV